MSLDTTTLESVQRPECFLSANKYASYLWIGHCVFNVSDFREGELAFCQDEALADREAKRFEEQVAHSPESILLRKLASVVASASLEIDRKTPVTGMERRRLQVYLGSEVWPQGMQYSAERGDFEEDPELALVENPFKDPLLVDGAIRCYRRRSSGVIAKEVLSYVTLDKLLPGYPPAISQE